MFSDMETDIENNEFEGEKCIGDGIRWRSFVWALWLPASLTTLSTHSYSSHRRKARW